ncbi:hypothetical protein M422DRAFT_273016 [Sphaerobolus stellatus SS14]|uniref:Uncharacterized protein n=1 Tax=Sphaerobolus stellatus (strain SS14) TaxID=990650 RepID=A0A0C9TA95_SPHS4|nr:hypothetical protein M422DRAFT_273016 [Sphaerobolus stellatus SS14]
MPDDVIRTDHAFWIFVTVLTHLWTDDNSQNRKNIHVSEFERTREEDRRAGMELRWRPAALLAPMKSPASTATKWPHPEPSLSSFNHPAPRPKHTRPKTSKACRKQGDGCHRCEVTGIPCVFQSEFPATDAAKERKPRLLLSRAQAQKLAANGGARLNSTLVRRNTVPDRYWRQDARLIEADLLSPSGAQQLKQQSSWRITHHGYQPYLPLHDSHHHAFDNLPISQHRHSRDRFPHMVYTAPFLHHLLSPRHVPSPRRPNLRKPDLLARHRVSLLPTRTYHVASRTSGHHPARSRCKANGTECRRGSPPEDLDLILLWYAICSNEYLRPRRRHYRNLHPTTLLSTSFGTLSSIALSHGPIADYLLTLQCSLHFVIVGAMGERTLQPNVPKTRETMRTYGQLFAFLSKLGEWEIEFKAIKAETPHAFHIHFAALKIEYHYPTVIYVTHFSSPSATPSPSPNPPVKQKPHFGAGA